MDIAANGVVAQDMLGKKEYDLCLVDIRTPIMNGKALYQYIKEEHPELVNKVIFTTGDILDSNVEFLFKEANRLCLPKPFIPDELRAIVRQALSG